MGFHNRFISRPLVLAVVIVLAYALYSVIDHNAYYSESAAVVIADAKAIGVDDVDCSFPVLVKTAGTSAGDYRCPAWAPRFAAGARPFLPWPTYTSGHSNELVAAIDSIRLEAIQPIDN